MKHRSILKYLSFGLLGLIILMLITATILEKIYGTTFSVENLYSAPYTVAAWGLLAVSATAYLVTTCPLRQVVTIALHLSFVLILAGALLTHMSGKQGMLHLREDSDVPAVSFVMSDGSVAEFPFSVRLKDFSLEYYAGTSAPMDYVSTIVIADGEMSHEAAVSMNNIHRYRGYRFYQSGFDRDGRGASITVAYDPWGIGVTYAGYLSLLLSMAGFFFQKGSRFRALLSHPSLKKALSVILTAGSLAVSASASESRPQTLSPKAAEAFGDLYIYYNDRICPMQTFARDFTVKLYGKSSYKGLTPEQVLTGWFFFYDDWKREPFIKIKGADARELLGTEGKYATLLDYSDRNGYRLENALRNEDGADIRNIHAANEKFNLISMVCTGSLIKIYPFTSSEDVTDAPVWYSLADRLPSDMGYEEWAFVTGSMNYVAETVAMKDDARLIELLGKIRKYQVAKGGDFLPSDALFKAEKIYNSSNWNKPLAMFCMSIGIIAFLLFCLGWSLADRRGRVIRLVLTLICGVIFTYLTFHIGLRWYVSGHVPLSNGFETMQFMAWSCMLLCFCIQKRLQMAQPFGILVCGSALLVSMMGESNPQVTQLMPVLQSPLLSSHVMVIMISYTLFAFMMLDGIAAVILYFRGRKSPQKEIYEGRIGYLMTVSNIMLYPAVFLLAVGIFIGAVWANVSWGRYWGWDPKEVWALITMLVYSLGLHQKSLVWFRKPMHFHMFCIIAFLCVLITYFGVNFILGGLHSYA